MFVVKSREAHSKFRSVGIMCVPLSMSVSGTLKRS